MNISRFIPVSKAEYNGLRAEHDILKERHGSLRKDYESLGIMLIAHKQAHKVLFRRVDKLIKLTRGSVERFDADE